MSTDVYTVFAYDINTNTKLTELPANNLAFDSRLNDAGAINFDVKLDDPAVATLAAPILAYNGNPFALYVDRDGSIVWSGASWTTNYTLATKTLTIGGKEWLAYFGQRVIPADYSVVTYPSGIDPAQLIYKALTDSQNTTLCGPGANIGISVVGGSSSLPMFIPGYSQSQNTLVEQIVNDVTSANIPGYGGVDVSILSAWNPTTGAPTTTATIWSPRVGRAAGQTGLIFDLGNVIDYTWPVDGTKTGNYLFATAAGAGTAIPSTTVTSGVPIGGLGQPPRLDQVVGFNNVQSQSQLSAMANGVIQVIGKPPTSPTVTFPTAGNDGAPGLGSWIVGDDARLVANDERFPGGLDQYWRIVSSAVRVPDQGVPQVTLTFNAPPRF